VPVDPDPTPLISVPSPDKPDMVELGHGLVMLLGGEMPISGLTPVLVVSVAPSGTVAPLSAALVLDPGIDSGDALPVVVSVDVQLDADPVPLIV
jgi:hypothetical protein